MKKEKPTTVDRHRLAYQVRVPLAFVKQLDVLAERRVSDRQTEVVNAVRAYLESHGLWPREATE